MASKSIYPIVRLIALVLLVFVSACNPQRETDSPNSEENRQEKIQKDDESSDKENEKDEDEENKSEKDEDDSDKDEK